MRRFFSLLMCVSGMSLAVTLTQADDSGSLPVAELGEPQAVEATADTKGEPEAPPEPLEERIEDYRQKFGGDDIDADVRILIEKLEQLAAESQRVGEKYTGKALERAQTEIAAKVARIEAKLAEIEADFQQGPAGEPVEARAARVAQKLVEGELANLRSMLEKAQESATDEAQAARAALEGQIDELETYLAERREQRDAGADLPEPVARLRHLNAAIEHLEAAGLRDVANNVREHAHREIQNQRAAEALRRHRAERAAAEPPGIEEERRQLKDQVRELNSKVRQLQNEIENLRRKPAAEAAPAPGESE